MQKRLCFFFSSRRRHTRWTGDWSSDVCSSDLGICSFFIFSQVYIYSVYSTIAQQSIQSSHFPDYLNLFCSTHGERKGRRQRVIRRWGSQHCVIAISNKFLCTKDESAKMAPSIQRTRFLSLRSLKTNMCFPRKTLFTQIMI